ncbi:hypothetical protein HK098_003530 [Nowakowskiella sp. JEL0407]|nr:hypothetical protein HK098_003530 [Nowakowskiella sp. JEL0407]
MQIKASSSKSSVSSSSASLPAHLLLNSALLNTKNFLPTIACQEPSLPAKSPNATLPNELVLLILSASSTEALLTIRSASKSLKSLCDLELAKRVQSKTIEMEFKSMLIEATYRETEKQKRPHLRHYRQFLRDVSAKDISEATWYSSPPTELQVVCECLCILKNGISGGTIVSDDESKGNLSWSEIKKQMSKYEFRAWFTNIRGSVDFIPMKNVRKVERIIMYDRLITYERLREVSTAGYKMLIIVAACLQYCNISEELKIKEKEIKSLRGKIGVAKKFLKAIDAEVQNETVIIEEKH